MAAEGGVAAADEPEAKPGIGAAGTSTAGIGTAWTGPVGFEGGRRERVPDHFLVAGGSFGGVQAAGVGQDVDRVRGGGR